MTLRFKRNLPLVLTLASLLAILVLAIGNQPVISFIASTGALPSVSLTGMNNNAGLLAGFLSMIQP